MAAPAPALASALDLDLDLAPVPAPVPAPASALALAPAFTFIAPFIAHSFIHTTPVFHVPFHVPFPFHIVENVALAIRNAIVTSRALTIRSVNVRLIQVLSSVPNGTVVQTLAVYLKQFNLKLSDVDPYMVMACRVVVFGSGPTKAYALPGTIVVSAPPASNNSICNTVIDFVSQRGEVLLSQIGILPGVSGAVGRGQTLLRILMTDSRLKVTGTLGDVRVGLAVQAEPVPTPVSSGGQVADAPSLPEFTAPHDITTPLKTLLDQLKIGEQGVLASRVGKMAEVKALTRHACLKDLVGLIPQSYVLKIAIPTSPGSATIYKVAVAEA
jgi:hypothetical protein